MFGCISRIRVKRERLAAGETHMAKTVGVIEIVMSVTTEFDAEFRKQFPPNGKYISANSWSEAPAKYTSYRPMGPFLIEIEKRLKKKFGKSAAALDLDVGKPVLTKFYGQPVQQMVAYVTGKLITILAESPNAKIV